MLINASLGRLLQMSMSLRAGTVISPGSAASSSATRPTSSTSEVGTGQRQLLPLYDEKNVGQHRQGLTALDDASNQLQGFNRASR